MSFLVGEVSSSIKLKSRDQNNLKILYSKEIASTNDWAKEIAFSDTHNDSSELLILTDYQTQGRGRGSHSWSTPAAGTSLLSSWIFSLDTTPSPITSIRVGLALYQACHTTWPSLSFSLKAPNDLYLNGKKVAGILLENLQQGSKNKLIVGIGLNVFAAPALPETMGFSANSLHEHCQITNQNWSLFLERLFLELKEAVTNPHSELSLMNRQAALHALNQNPNLKEKYISLEPDGSLVLTNSKIHWRDL
jgi:BirA family biotin operon repressor/biotin-[acetyl-CoA-carboxylase] ligase